MTTMMRKRPQHDQRGFTLLMSALVASVVLSIGVAIFSIVEKEVKLSSIGRDSQFAFYVADSAADCALYWEWRHTWFGSTTPPADISCDGQTVPVKVTETQDAFGDWESSTFSYEYTPGGLCAQVFVVKYLDGNILRTTVHADGFSVACGVINTSNRALQRSVELNF